jgi:hypothetical protein
MKTYWQRCEDAEKRLAAAAGAEGLQVQITIKDFDFTARFQRGDSTWTTPEAIDIAVLEDDPSPTLDLLIERAKREIETIEGEGR